MSQRKMYSAFISSVYESLRDERSIVIDCLLDYSVFPVCMEHFTASVNRQFKDIEERIDESDFFVLILGAVYGSRDENGVSWTEREYKYAVECGKPIIAIFCDELVELRKKDVDELTEDEKCQLSFSNQIAFGRSVTETMTIQKIMAQFFTGYDFSSCVGWSRAFVLGEREIAEWREAHKAWKLDGEWYHVHLSADDDHYIRTGTIRISQQFDPEHYKKLTFDGLNYNIRYNAESKEIGENLIKRTHWRGVYEIDDEGAMFGVFTAKREFSGTFNEHKVDKGTRRGIHDFKIPVHDNVAVTCFEGEFHDEAPSPKIGVIYVFRTRQMRDDFLVQNFAEVLKNNQGGV